jgi:uncharacterized membrane protein (DUF373 family)
VRLLASEGVSTARNLSKRIRGFVRVVPRVATGYIEVLEAILVIVLMILTFMALVILVRDLISLRVESSLSEFQIIVSDVLVLVILVELTRSFTISSLGGERYLEGFIEMGIIILVRELALAAMAANMINALMASGGATLLILALWFTKERKEPEP